MSSTAAPSTNGSTHSPLSPSLPETGRQVTWSQLYGDTFPLALENAARQHQAPFVVVTPDTGFAEKLLDQLRFFSKHQDLPLFSFPDWETLPYDTFSPHQDIISERLTALHRLPELKRGIVVVPVATLLQRLSPRSYLEQQTFILDKGDTIDLDQLRERLDRAGYQCVSQVVEHGEFAIRGSLVDLYPMGSPLPYRIDLFDDEVESIRTFDPETQRSEGQMDSIRLLPAREFPLDEAAISAFRQPFRQRFEGDPNDSLIYRDVSNGIAPAGIEYYLPLFFDETDTLFDYLPRNAVMVRTDDTEAASDRFWEQTLERFESRRHDRERPV